MLILTTMLLSCFSGIASAAEMGRGENYFQEAMRASWSFSTDIPANTSANVSISFPLEVGEAVAISYIFFAICKCRF
jgi:hypothetical protein